MDRATPGWMGWCRRAIFVAASTACAGCGSPSPISGVEDDASRDAREVIPSFGESDAGSPGVVFTSDAAQPHGLLRARCRTRLLPRVRGGVDFAVNGGDGGTARHWTSNCRETGGALATYLVAPGQSFVIDVCGPESGQSLYFDLGGPPPTEPGPVSATMQAGGIPGLPDVPIHAPALVDFTTVALLAGEEFAGTFVADVNLPDAVVAVLQGTIEACLLIEATE